MQLPVQLFYFEILYNFAIDQRNYSVQPKQSNTQIRRFYKYPKNHDFGPFSRSLRFYSVKVIKTPIFRPNSSWRTLKKHVKTPKLQHPKGTIHGMPK